MTVRCGFGLGEVVWEHAWLDAAANTEGIVVTRRYVDAAGVLRDRGGAPDVLIVSPALRGFEAKAMRAIVDAGIRLVVIVDSIRPPWIEDADLEVHEMAGLDVLALLAGLGSTAVRPKIAANRTVFVGTGGGVGTTTLACSYAAHTVGARFVEADPQRSSAALLLGSQHPGVIPLASRILREPLDDALQDVAHHLVVDAGTQLDLGPWVDEARLVLVTAATPLGVARVCMAAEALAERSSGLVIVLNRVRPSAIGTPRGGAALRALVERATGIDPVLVPDRTDVCDAAWLRGDVRLLRDLVLPLSANGAEHHEAA